MNNDEKEFLSIKEFAALLGIHQTTVRRSIKKGRLNALRIGQGQSAVYRIPRTETHRLSYENLENVIKKMIHENRT